MKKNSYRLILLALGALLICIALFWLGQNPSSADVPPQATAIPTARPRTTGPSVPVAIFITITNSGFTPNVVTITAGTLVTWYNATGTTQVLQDGAPSFQFYLPFIQKDTGSSGASPSLVRTPTPRARTSSILNSDIFSGTIPPGGTFSYTFNNPGEIPFHLLNSQQFSGKVVVQGSPTPSFVLSAQPVSRTVTQGNNVTYTVQLTATNGFTAPVTLSLSGLPQGASASFTANPVVPNATVALTVTALVTTSPSTYALSLRGVGGNITQTVPITLQVNALPASPDFVLVARPISQTVAQGASATYTAYVTATNGFTQPVTLALSGLPTGSMGFLSTNPINPTGSSLITITTSASTPIASTVISVQGTGGTVSHTTAITLNVVAPPVADFTIATQPVSQTVSQGNGVSYTALVTATNGFTRPVTLSLTGLPQGANANFGTNPVSPTGSSSVNVTTAIDTPVGIWALVLSGSDSTITRTSSITLVVQPPLDFIITTPISTRTVAQGSSIDYTFYVTGTNGFTAPVTLGAIALPRRVSNPKAPFPIEIVGLPAGVNAFASANPVIPNGTSVVTFTTSVTTPVAVYPIMFIASGSGIMHTVPITLVVQPPPDFVLDAQPSNQSVTQGSSITYTLGVTGTFGFTAPVTLTVSGLPQGTSGIIKPNPVIPNATSVLTISTAITTTPSTNQLTVQATSGSITHTTPITLVVNPTADFTVSVQPASRSASQGASVAYTVYVTGTNGYTLPITLSLTGLPSGATSTFATNPVAPNTSTVVTITTPATTTVATYPMTVIGTSGGASRNSSLSLNVTAIPRTLCGNISQNTFLPATYNVYQVTCNVTIDPNVTLTLGPGVIVKFIPGTSIQVSQGATLNAIATSGSPIYFTSLRDDTVGGDTNNDGSTTLPAAGDWGEIFVAPSNSQNVTVGTLNLDYVTMRYGGSTSWWTNPYVPAMLWIDGAANINHSTIERSSQSGITIWRDANSNPAVTIQNSNIRYNSNWGLYAYGVSPLITNNTINNNDQRAQDGYGGLGLANSNATVSGNTIANNYAYGIQLNMSTATVSNNTFNNQYRAIAVQSNQGSPTSSQISGNTVTRGGTTKDGVGIESSFSTPALTNNTVSGFAFPVWISNGYPQVVPTFSGNTFSNHQYTAIAVSGELTSGAWTQFVGYLTALVSNSHLSSGMTLTIPAGTIVKVLPFSIFSYYGNGGLHIDQNATLNAIGTSGSPIYFTSIKDDVGGDTNNDGGTTLPAAGDWGGFYLSPSTSQNATVGTINFDYVTMRYGSAYCPWYCTGSSMLRIGGAASIDHSTIERGSQNGIEIFRDVNSTPTVTIQNTNIRYHYYWGLSLDGVSPLITNNTINNNDQYSRDGYGGIYLANSNSTVSGNTIANNYAYGIQLNMSTATVSNNNFSNQYRAIAVLSNQGSPTSPQITGNIVTRGGTTKDGVGIESSFSTPALTNNTVSGFAFPVWISSGYPQVVPTFNSNTFSNHQYTAIAVSGELTSGAWTQFVGYLTALVGNSHLSSGMTLTIPAGTIVKILPFSIFNYYGNGSLNIDQNATLNAIGTSGSPIYFTSIKDDVGGDTNNDGGTTLPVANDWGAFYVAPSNSQNATVGTINFDYVTMRYGSAYYCAWYCTGSSMLRIGGAASIDHSTIERGGQNGIEIFQDPNSLPIVSVQNSTVRYHQNGGIVVNGVSPTIQWNSIYGTISPYGYGLLNQTTYPTADARNNWWGSDSGPTHASNPLGTGDRVSDNVLFDPWIGKTGYVPHNSSPSTSWTSFVADPVNVVFGNYTYQHQDLQVPSIGLAFSFERGYNSANTSTNGPLGYGWTHSYNWSVVQQTVGLSNTVLVTAGDGRVDRYFQNQDGTFTAPTGIYDVLTLNAGTYILTRKDQTRLNFNGSGKLATMVDKNNNTATLTYSGSNLASITDTAGRSYAFTSDASGRITAISDPIGRTAAFGYDASGNLSSFTDARGKVTTYAYDANHRLTSITDANGHAFVQNTYDSNGRVTQQRDGQLNLSTFSYDTLNYRTVITNPRGFATTHTYDNQSRIVSERDPLNQTISYGYDVNNNRTQVTDKRGYTTYYAYDSRGNVTSITDALSNVYQFTYDSHNNLLTKTDPLSRVTTNTYSANDNLLTTTNISGTTTFGYNVRGLLTSLTDARSNTTQFGYNANGDRNSSTDAVGNATTFTYDNGGRRSTLTDPLAHTTQFAYNANNNPTTITDALSHTTSYAYDNVGNKISITDANSNLTRFGYDAKDQLVVVTDTVGSRVLYAYDSVGNKVSMTDANNHTTTYTYDALNRLVTVTDPLNRTTTYGYDANGNKTSILDANGRTTTFGYDQLNRLTAIQYPAPSSYSVSFTYDAVGNRLTMSDPTGTTYFTYDALDRLTRAQAPNGTVQYAYDAVGNRTRTIYPNSNSATFSFDAANRLKNVIDWASRTITYTYDAASNRTALDYPNGAHTIYAYDTLNRSTAITTTTPVSGTIFFSRYTLDNVGNRMQMVDSEGTTNYSYDSLYRLTNVTYPDATSTQYTYDAMGNRITMTPSGSGAVNYTYDIADRLLTAGATTFTWDNNGNQLTKGTATYQYDVANRLTQVVNGAITDQFTYDGDGKRARKTINGVATDYVYDINAALPIVLTETTGGATTTYLYGTDLLVRYDNAGTPTYYHADGLGSVRATTNSAGQRDSSINYDAFGSVRNSSGANSTFKFAGEQSDDEAGLVYLRARYYDPATGRFLNPDPFAGLMEFPSSLNRYPYAQGNPVRYTDPSGRIVPLIAAAIGVPIAVGATIAFLANPEPVNAPSNETLFLYKEQPFKPVIHAVESVALSKLFAPLKPGLLKGGSVGLLAGVEKYAFGTLLGQVIDDYLYGDGRVLNPYFNPTGNFFGGGSSHGHGASGSWGEPPGQGK